MLKLFKHSILLVLILIVCDRIGGFVLEKLFYKQHHGDDFVSIQLLDSTNADILVFGSSRASHHYVSDSLEAYSNLKVYNGGRDNMGIHYTLASLQVVLKRYHPKQIIFDIIPYNFLKGNQDAKKYYDAQTSVLLPFANKHRSIYNVVSSISQLETWKAKCVASYAYNSLIGSIVQNAYTHMGHSQVKGYEPLDGSIDSVHYVKPIFPFPTEQQELDTTAFTLLKSCLDLCKENNVKAYIVFSPFYFQVPMYPVLDQQFLNLSSSTNAILLDFSRDSFFTKNPTVFYDELHLNNQGATLFTKKLQRYLLSEAY